MKQLSLQHLLLSSFMILFLIVSLNHKTIAQSPTPTTVPLPPYQTIQINMYRLDGNNSAGLVPIPCVKDDESYGCTAIPNKPKFAYPFGDENPVTTLKLESDIRDGKQQGYIHNVTAKELGPHIGSQGNKLFSSVQAQAIAVRTYAYQRYANQHPVDQGGYGPINNSSQFQVYLPYFYNEVLITNEQQNRIDDAVRPVIYMTEQGKQHAIEALFGTDNCKDTSEGSAPYLQLVNDPISIYAASLGTQPCKNSDRGTGSGGMSSNGASRWGFGLPAT